MKRILSTLLAFGLILSLVAFAVPVLADEHEVSYPDDPTPGEPYDGYTGDPYTRDPTELMTKEYFGNEWVNTIPSGIYNDDATPKLIMSPFEHHGYITGSPLQLTPYVPYDGPGSNAGQFDYFYQLAERSPRVTFWTFGEPTNTGLTQYVCAISTADTINRLEEYQENLLKLADPRMTTEAEAQALIADASQLKPIFWYWQAPSSESGGSECDMELAYRMAVEERDVFQDIRDNVIMLFSDCHPDGTQMVAEWVNYHQYTYGNLVEGFNDGWEPSTPYYTMYTQHDNNRDSHTNTMPARLNLVQEYNKWPAQVVLEPHEVGFLLYTFSGMEPTSPATDPITQSEWQWFAARELNQAEQFGMPGVWEYKFVNMYYPFYQLQVAHMRSATGKFYEVYHTNGFYTTTNTVNVSSRNREWMWYSPMPYESDKLVWSFRNNINYSETMAITTAWQIATNRETVLQNYWVKSKNAVSNAGQTAIGSTGYFTWAYAYAISSEQKDMPDTYRMIDNLLGNGIEITTADSAFTIGDKSYPAGSFIINMQQPYSRLIHTLFQIEFWPEGSPAPYDATAWQYDLMRDVEVDRIDNPAIYDVPVTPFTGGACPFTISGETAAYYLVDHDSINNIVTLVYDLAQDGFTCYASEGSEGGIIDPGDVIISADQDGVYDALVVEVGKLGLTMHSLEGIGVPMHELNVPRVGMYHSWRSIQDGGWSRYTFEQFLPTDDPDYYQVIQRTDVLLGDLKADFDVIFLPDVSASRLKGGVSGDLEEIWYGPVQTEHRTGGLGDAGIAALKQFVDEGGMLICNNASTDFPIKYDFIEYVSRVRADTAPGPIVAIEPKDSPITYGADEQECIYQNQSPAFVAPEEWVVASYPEDPEDIMLSGYLTGAEKLAGNAAIVAAPSKDAPENGGSVVLFGTDITYRWQAHGAYFYLWNCLLSWDDLAIPEGTPTIGGGSTVGLTINVEEGLIAISVSPSEIDFGTVLAGQSTDAEDIEVENIGTVACDVDSEVIPTETVFDYLTLDGVACDSWAISLVFEASDTFPAQLVVPSDASPGVETAQLVFTAFLP